jgi:hypothetical protein
MLKRHRLHALALSFVAPCLALGMAACLAPTPPELPFTAEVEAGVVYASSQARAREIAGMLQRVTPAVHAALPGCANEPVDVRMVAKMEHSQWGGATYTTDAARWIELPEAERGDRLEATLVHELVHFQLGDDWSTLPGVLEEGLCDYVAHGIVPSAAALERAEYAVMLATAIDGGFRFDAPRITGHGKDAQFDKVFANYTVRAPIERDHLPSFEEALSYHSADLEPIRAQGVRGVLDAVGYTIVSRIGVGELHKLCLRAKIQRLRIVPGRWLFQAAGIDPEDRSAWRAAAWGMFGEEEKLALLRRGAVEFQASP